MSTTTGLATDTGGTSTGTTWTTTFDCTSRPPGPFPAAEYAILTEEDFSFDMDGHLVYQSGTAIMGADTTGAAAVLATGAPGDPAGLDVVSATELLIAGPDTGTLRVMDLVNGSGETPLANLTRPNTVLGGRDGLYYVSELNDGRVRWYDPMTELSGPAIAGIGTANGLALSPDEQILYSGGTDTIWAVARDPVTGEWDPDSKWELHTEPGWLIYALDVDVCGWIYFVDYSGGSAKRVSPDGLTVEPLAQLPGGGWAWGGMNFGNGVGGWERDWLYFTNRSTIVGLAVGVPGAPGPNIPP